MKKVTVYEDTHRDIKILAAQTGETVSQVVSAMIRHCKPLVESGKLKIADEPEEPKTGEAA